MPKILNHPNDVSGTTILDDGVKIYWTEGRSSSCVARHPDGRLESFSVFSDHPLMAAEEAAELDPNTTVAAMAEADIAEWESARTSAS